MLVKIKNFNCLIVTFYLGTGGKNFSFTFRSSDDKGIVSVKDIPPRKILNDPAQLTALPYQQIEFLSGSVV